MKPERWKQIEKIYDAAGELSEAPLQERALPHSDGNAGNQSL
jgi:hypothetical protein